MREAQLRVDSAEFAEWVAWFTPEPEERPEPNPALIRTQMQAAGIRFVKKD